MSKIECDQGIEKLGKLLKWVENDFTELDTRAKVIDPLFIECLGWNEEDIRRETHIHSGYLDYVFSIDEARKFVVEAKKVKKSFNIPTSLGGRYYTIRGTISTHNDIKNAIEQAQQYCINSGVNYGIVTNGQQYIIFEAFKYGKDWRSGQCLVFRSLKDIKKNWGLFWNTLSKENVRNGSLRKCVSKEDLPQPFFRPLDNLKAKDSSITRNDLSPLLQPFSDRIFADITDESQLDVLEKCYVVKKQYQDASLHINRHLDRPPGFAKKYSVNMIIESATCAGKFQESFEKCEKFLSTKAPEGSLILLMGGIGCGKTTFVHHFFNFVTKSPETTLWFYVDFLDEPDSSKIKEHIFSSITREFEHKYRDKLKNELQSVGLASISSNIKDITILFSLLTLKGYTISLVLDNVDQHSYVSPEYQERALLIAKQLKERLKTITILTLREESFFRSTMSGVLDAFPVPVFHISSPSFEDLVRYRVDYVLDLLYKNSSEIQRLGSNKDVIKMFFEIIENSLRSTRKKGTAILRFMDEISGGDMRQALYFLSTFLLSGNTDVEEMLRIERYARKKKINGYQIPFHHVIKSIILEHSMLYSSSRSRIMNLFAVNPEYTNSHFLHLRILSYLRDRMSFQRPQGRGYVDIDSILSEGERVGINRTAIADSLKTMAIFGLIQFENQSKKGYENATYVRITNAGMYYIEELVHKFVYLDLVWMDTPISNKNLMRELLKHVTELKRGRLRKDLNERFQRTQLFLDYLEAQEEKEHKENPEFMDSDLTRGKFIPEIIKSYQESKKYIVEKRFTSVQ